MTTRRAWVAWSSGKDSALALHHTRRHPGIEVTGLLTTLDAATNAVTMHGVPHALVEAQAHALGLPLHVVALPDPCPDQEYRHRMDLALDQARAEGTDAVIFGDIHLADVRRYRESAMSDSGIEPLFPLWGQPVTEIARRIVEVGIDPVITCVDTHQLDTTFVGRRYDASLLGDLPPDVDPCGENGEIHTFVTNSPDFDRPIDIVIGAPRTDGRFARVPLGPAHAGQP